MSLFLSQRKCDLRRALLEQWVNERVCVYEELFPLSQAFLALRHTEWHSGAVHSSRLMLFHVSQSAQVGGLDSAASCQNNTPRRFVSAIVYTDRVIGAKNIQRATGKEAGERIFSEKKKTTGKGSFEK